MPPFELALVLASALLHAAWNGLVKQHENPLGFLLAAQLLAVLLSLPLLGLFHFSEIPAPVWRLLALTAGVHAIYGYSLSRAYEEADLSAVYPICRSTPALVPLLAVPLYGERLTGPGAAGIALVLLGIWLVHRTSPSHLADPRLRFAYLTLLATVAYSMLDKRAMTLLADAPWTGAAPAALVYCCLITAAHVPPLALLSLHRAGPRKLRTVLRADLPRLFACVVASLASYGLILHALRTAPLSYVVAVRQTSVAFALLLSLVWLRERPGPLRVAGAVLTVAGVGVITVGG